MLTVVPVSFNAALMPGGGGGGGGDGGGGDGGGGGDMTVAAVVAVAVAVAAVTVAAVAAIRSESFIDQLWTSAGSETRSVDILLIGHGSRSKLRERPNLTRSDRARLEVTEPDSK